MNRFLFATALVLFSAHLLAGKVVNYKIDGQEYEGYFNEAMGQSKGMVVIVHDWDGLTDYEIKRTEMLSVMGFDAFAVDVYGKGVRPTGRDAKKAQTKKLYTDREKMRRLIIGGLNEAKKHSSKEVVIAGYCFGGAVTLELARSGKAEDIAGYATFHGGLATPEGQSYAQNKSPIFVAHGGADTSVKMSDVASLAGELESNNIPYEIEIYSGAPHAFTVFGSKRYTETADKKSWAAFKDFLGETL
ncbi:MAG: dienelactone hydrolase family protein [Sedimenticola sp.]